jgi:hypothetical protein
VAKRGFVKVSLADPMKRAVADWFDWSHARLWGPSENRNVPDPTHGGLTVRKALQFLGTEIGRELYRDVWIDYALRVVDELENCCCYDRERGIVHNEWSHLVEGVVIPDVRFLNEVTAIRARGGKIVQVVRPGAGLQGAAAQHVSEKEQEGLVGDVILANVGTLAELEAMALDL